MNAIGEILLTLLRRLRTTAPYRNPLLSTTSDGEIGVAQPRRQLDLFFYYGYSISVYYYCGELPFCDRSNGPLEATDTVREYYDDGARHCGLYSIGVRNLFFISSRRHPPALLAFATRLDLSCVTAGGRARRNS